ncbi:iron-sulfur cluster assembly scaffold protein [Consotaella aegiceratis]|uniref:iron-sulfur cluster assembly scaffold protein n=1 Tax=Consotaella aegiceratis TaxID=3097961 RepID=UPI002F41C0AC
MLTYSEAVRDHFFNPRNAGALLAPDAVGAAGSLACGDALKLMLRIDPETATIEDARFQSFGGGASVAAGSVLTELVIGRTVEQAMTISECEVIARLDGLPASRLYCSVMGCEALATALTAWNTRAAGEGRTASSRDMPLCACSTVGERAIQRVIRSHRLTSLQALADHTKAGLGCTACRDRLESLLAEANAAMVADGLIPAAEAFRRPGASPSPQTSGRMQIVVRHNAKPPVRPMGAPGLPIGIAPPIEGPRDATPEDIAAIAGVIDEMRPVFKADGGDVEFVEFDGTMVRVRLTGTCAGCQIASLTLGGLRQRITQMLNRPVRIMPVTTM